MGRTAIVVSHVRGLGPAQYLEEFLVSRCRVVLSIRHPLICDSYSKSEYRLFEDGLLVATGERQLRGPEGAIRCQEVILTVSWVRRLAPRADFFFGIDALNSFCGILLRSIRSTKRVIFYTIDWSPNRFDRRALNGIYHLTDRAAARRNVRRLLKLALCKLTGEQKTVHAFRTGLYFLGICSKSRDCNS